MKKTAGLFLWMLWALSSHAGTLTSSVTSLPTFGNCPVFYASDPQRFVLSGTGISAVIVLQAPEHYELSTSYTTAYSNRIQLNATGGTLSSTTVYVRFSPYVNGSQSGTVSCSSAGSNTVNINVSGTATATPASGTGAATYYNSIGISSGSALKTALYNRILGHSVTSYSGLWGTYSTTDALYNGKVWDIYSTRLDAPSPYEYTFSTQQCGTYSIEGDCYNREHSFPQSWFSSNSPMVSDMFHIYPTDGKVNGMRNNYPHGEVSSPTYTSLQGGKLGPNITSGYTGITFEPINDYKGDLARSFFYMATRYENLIAGWQTNGNADDVLAGNAYPAYDAWFLQVLVKWHNQDPPSVKEINRNNAVYGYQGNRNPYIDSPQYVNRIWGGAGAVEPTQASASFTLRSNTTTTALIGWSSGNGQRRLVLARAGSPVNALPVDSNSYAASAAFGSGAQIGSGNFVVYNGSGTTFQVSGLNSSTTYYFTVVEYNGAGKAINYLTSTVLQSGAISLPLTWVNHEVRWKSPGTVVLDWTTADELHTKDFEIEVWNNGAFEKVGTMQAKGTSSGIHSYQMVHHPAAALLANETVLQYRIRQNDLDGKFTYSKTLVLENPFANGGIFTVENPVRETISLRSLLMDEEADLEVYDAKGNVVLQKHLQLQHENHLQTDSELAPGLYVLDIRLRTGTYRFRIIKG